MRHRFFIFTKQAPEVCGLPDSSWRWAEAQPRAGAAGDCAALGCASQAVGPARRPALPIPSRRCTFLERPWGLATGCSSVNLGKEELV